MSVSKIRKGISQANYNEAGNNLFFIEAIIAGILLGFISKSFAIGIIGSFGFTVIISFLSVFRITNILANISLSSVWGFTGYALCIGFQTNLVPSIVIGIIIFLVTWASRAGALQYIADITE